MVALAIFEETDDVFDQGSLVELFAVVIAPLFALAAAHSFSDAIDIQVRTGHPLTGDDWRHLVLAGLQYLARRKSPVMLVSRRGCSPSGGRFLGQLSMSHRGIGVPSLFPVGAHFPPERRKVRVGGPRVRYPPRSKDSWGSS
jgi:hypothetical protein